MRPSFLCLALFLMAVPVSYPIGGFRALASREGSYLQKAVLYYRKGDWKKARIYLRLQAAKKATKDSQKNFSGQGPRHKRASRTKAKAREAADAAKLRLLLALSSKNETETRRLLLEYLLQKPDAFWFYYQGILEFQERHYKKSKESLQNALRLWKAPSKEQRKRSYEPALMPILCFWPLPKRSALRAPLPRPFREHKKAESYWTRRLSTEEAIAALYLVNLFEKAFGKSPPESSGTKALEHWEAAFSIPSKGMATNPGRAKKSKSNEKIRLDAATLALFLSTESPAQVSQKKIYQRCAKSLQYELQENLTGRLLRPYDRKKIQTFLLRLAFFRLLSEQSPTAAFDYADLLLQKKRPYEALYVLRRLLEKQKLYQIPNAPSRLPLLKEVLFRLARAYLQMGLKKDALSSERLAVLIKNYLQKTQTNFPEKNSRPKFAKHKPDSGRREKQARSKNSPESGEKSRPSKTSTGQIQKETSGRSSYTKPSYKKFLQEIFQLAGENLMHRESLLLLIEVADDAHKKQILRKRLQERDQRREDLELQGAFTYLNFSGS